MHEALAIETVHRAAHIRLGRGQRMAIGVLGLGECQRLVRHPAPGVVPVFHVAHVTGQPLADLVQLLNVGAAEARQVHLRAHRLRPKIMVREIPEPGADHLFCRHI